jgi:hypothetical protein
LSEFSLLPGRHRRELLVRGLGLTLRPVSVGSARGRRIRNRSAGRPAETLQSAALLGLVLTNHASFIMTFRLILSRKHVFLPGNCKREFNPAAGCFDFGFSFALIAMHFDHVL